MIISKKTIYTISIIFVLVVAVYLRLYHLGSRPLYLDEPDNTVAVAVHSVSYIISTNFGSILYPLLLHFLLPLGQIELIARIPAALFGILSVWIIYLIGKTVLSRKEAILAALFSAVSTHFLYFSQQARGYSGLLLFSLLSLYFFLKILDKGKLIDSACYVLFTVISAYMHFFSLILVPVQVVYLVFRLFVQRRLRGSSWATPVEKKGVKHFFINLIMISVLVFIFYYPSRSYNAKENLYAIIPQLTKGFFAGHWNINPIGLVKEIFERQLDYPTNPKYFFIKIALIGIGLIASWRRKKLGMILMLFVMVVPLALFILSNPPTFYLPVDNKFIFLLAAVYLFMAGGVFALASLLGRVLTIVFKQIKSSRATAASFCLFVALLSFGEGYLLVIPSIRISNARSIDRLNALMDSLKKDLPGEYALFCDGPATLLNFLTIGPLFYPDGRKIIRTQELAISDFREWVKSRSNLVLFLKKGSGKADALFQREVNAEKIGIKPISQDRLAYFISDERPLWQKIAQACELVLAQSLNTDESASYHFYLAKIYLLAGQNQKALSELEIWRGLNSRQAERKDRDIVWNVLREDIFHLLLWNAMQALIEGEKESALSLWEKASQFAFNRPEWQGKIYFSKAEAWHKKGNIEEAKRFYLKTLAFCRSRDDEVQVINKIKELFSFSSCYIIWREQNEWHLRWLADGQNEFSGMISSLPPCLKKKRTWLEANGSVKSANKEIFFHSKIESNKLQGFNFTAAALSKIRFLLKIDGDINILNRIILADGMEPPKKMPFFIE